MTTFLTAGDMALLQEHDPELYWLLQGFCEKMQNGVSFLGAVQTVVSMTNVMQRVRYTALAGKYKKLFTRLVQLGMRRN